MAQVVYYGKDLGDLTDPALLAYYGREPGAVIDGIPVPVPAEVTPEVDAVEVADAPEWPGKSASKQEKYDYAAAVDPDIEGYDDITVAELDERYGPAES